MKTWRLKRTRQCHNCPWKMSANVEKIPGYSRKKHEELRATIASSSLESQLKAKTFHVMSCHESDDGDEAHCIGWLRHQLSLGNNIILRIQMMSCENAADIKVFGRQYQSLEETISREIADE